MSTATMEGIEAPSSSHKLLMASIGLKFKGPNKIDYCRSVNGFAAY